MSREHTTSRTRRRDHAGQPTHATPTTLATALNTLVPVICLPSWIPLIRVIIIWILATTLTILVRCQPDTIAELLRVIGG